MTMGGAERVAATLADAWANKGYSVALMPTHSSAGPSFYKISDRVNYKTLTSCIDQAGAGVNPSYLQRLMHLRKFIREFQPDVIVAFLPNVSVMMLMAAFGLGLRTVVCERSDPFQMPVSLLLRLARNLLYPFASTLVVQTEAVAVEVANRWPRVRRVITVGNPIPLALIGAVKNQGPRVRKRLIAVGRLSEEKCFDRAILAFVRLADKFIDWDLRIVGEGPDRSRLERLIKTHAVGDRVFLPGSSSSVQDELALSDLFVLTSRFEGFPNALLEAMAMGLPCVTVDCPSGPREISEDGHSAVLVDIGNHEALIGELGSMMKDEEKRLEYGKRAQLSVWSRYSVREIVTRWELVLRGE